MNSLSAQEFKVFGRNARCNNYVRFISKTKLLTLKEQKAEMHSTTKQFRQNLKF